MREGRGRKADKTGAIAQLRDVLQGGKRRTDQYAAPDEAPIYEEVNDDHYKKLRQADDFVVDEGFFISFQFFIFSFIFIFQTKKNQRDILSIMAKTKKLKRKKQTSSVLWMLNGRKMQRSVELSTSLPRLRYLKRLPRMRMCFVFVFVHNLFPIHAILFDLFFSKIPDVLIPAKRATTTKAAASAAPPIPSVIIPAQLDDDDDDDDGNVDSLFGELDTAAEIARAAEQKPPTKKARVNDVRLLLSLNLLKMDIAFTKTNAIPFFFFSASTSNNR